MAKNPGKWLNDKLKNFSKDAVEAAMTKFGVDATEAFANGGVNIDSKIRGQITKELNGTVSTHMTRAERQTQQKTVSNVIENFGEQANSILNEAKVSGRPIQEVADSFSSGSYGLGRGQVPSDRLTTELPNSAWKKGRAPETRNLPVTMEDAEKMRQSDKFVDNLRSQVQRDKEASRWGGRSLDEQQRMDARYEQYKADKAGRENVRNYNDRSLITSTEERAAKGRQIYTKGEEFDFQENGNFGIVENSYRQKETLQPKKGETAAEYKERVHQERYNNSEERKNYERQQRQERIRKGQEARADYEQRLNNAQSNIDQANQEQRRREVEQNDRSWVQKKIDWWSGNDEGSKVFGGRNTRKDPSKNGGMTWEQQRQMANEAYITSGQGSYQSKSDFRRNHDAIMDGTFFDTKKAMSFDGLGDWAKEHPFLVAGAIAGTTVGAASIIGNMRDGD